MHIILTGATGLVGSGVLDALIKAKDITKISILTRRPIPMADAANDSRINVIIHKDFNTYDPKVLEQLQGARGCVWALGISQTQVSAEDYVKITKDYTLAAARSFATLSSATASDPFRFVYVSGEGATQTPGRFSQIFARVKGETETELAELTKQTPTLRADSARPAFVDAAAHKEILPYIPTQTIMLRLSTMVLGPPIKLAYKAFHSPTDMLGEFLMGMAMGKMDGKLEEGKGAYKIGPSWVVGNAGIRRAMGL